MEQFLVRTTENKILGPFMRDEIKRWISDGKLGLQDEVCQGNAYWFFLHEKEELNRFLEIQLPLSARKSSSIEREETTETQTQLISEDHTPALIDWSSESKSPVINSKENTGSLILQKSISKAGLWFWTVLLSIAFIALLNKVFQYLGSPH